MSHFSLKAERTNDCILLTQRDSQGKINEVRLNPWQLRAACEHFGLLTADPQAAKTIATLQRRMLALRDRIDALGDYLTNFSDHEHADLTHELITIRAMAELADEWCADFEDPPEAPARATPPAPALTAQQCYPNSG
jgi:hypothetical protein